MLVKSNNIFPTVFNNDLRAMFNHQYTEYCELGGRGSCKSSFLSVALILLMLKNKDYNALVLRKVGNTLSESVFEQLQWAISILGLENYFSCKKSPLQITHNITGQKIIFRGGDEPMKLKSIKLKKGYFAITWFEELTEFTPKDIQTIKLSTMRGGSLFWVFYSFNPPSSTRSWCNETFNPTRKDILIHKTDYRTVPKSWLGDAFLTEAENLKKFNKRAYENIFLGEATGTGRNIFENLKIKPITQSQIDSFDFIYMGIDWGFYPDPFAFGIMSFDSKSQTLYIFDELYLYKKGNYEAFVELQNHLQSLGYSITENRITADSAEPKSIADFRQWGANVRGAVKGVGSLNTGFKWLQSLHKIVIDPARCPKACNEFSLYEYEIDKKSGEILAGYPQGQPDHFMALTRYALEGIWKHRGE